MLTGALQPAHLIVVVVLALIVFGPSKLPELGASLGKSLREFKKTTDDLTEMKETVTSAARLEPPRATPPPTPLPRQPEAGQPERVPLRRQEID